MIMIRPHCWC